MENDAIGGEVIKQEKTKTKHMQVTNQRKLSPLVQLAMSKDIDPDRLDKLLEVQIAYEENEAKKAFSMAMSECQAEMPMIVKNAKNEHSTYAKHDAICRAIKPIYTKHGFSLSFYEGTAKSATEIRTVCDITHCLGHTKQRYIDLPSDGEGLHGKENKTKIQAKGSTFSYGRRYLTLMIYDLATYDDNDGNAPTEPVKLITKPQCNKIYKLIKTNNKYVTLSKFLIHIKKDSVEAIPAAAFGSCIKEIEHAIKLRKAKV